MPGFVVRGKLLKWGNSYGVRITKGDVEQMAKLGIHPGDEFEVQVGALAPAIDVGRLRPFPGPDRYSGWDHDDVLYLGQLEKLCRSGSMSQAQFARERKALEAKYVGRRH